MSSTTDVHDRGQVIVIFSLAIFALLVFAALAFDVGQTMLDRRKQQDAADAAALAGARYLTDAGCQPTSTPANCPSAWQAALAIAQANGYGSGPGAATVSGTTVTSGSVTVKIPPGPESQFSNFAGHIEVAIGTSRPSIIGGRWLPTQWTVRAMGVARNTSGIAAPYSFMALNQTACPSVLISGQGSITTGGSIQVNSSCPTGALQTTGQAEIDVTSPTAQINVVGGWASGGNATVNPTPVTSAPWQPDPLGTLPPPALPAAPASVVEISGTKTIPAGCPGSSNPATADAPATCQFPSTYAGTTWRIYPGYYPGGLKFQGGVFYLEPGIYYIGGGGLTVAGVGASVYSVDSGGSAPPMGGGIMIYNTEDATYHDQCAGTGTFPSGVTAAVACLGPIVLDGSQATINIQAMQAGTYAGIIIFQDRNLSLDPPSTPIATRRADVQINGSASTLDVVGTIYVPLGLFQANGNAGTASTIQVIADEFKVTGNNATITANYNGDAFFQLSGVGLVQ